MGCCSCTHAHAQTQTHPQTDRHMDTVRDLPKPQHAEMTHATLRKVQAKHKNTYLYFMCILWLVTLLEPLLLSTTQRVLTLPTISVKFSLCACVADGTHVWSMVAGWLEPEVSGGFICNGGGSEDNNMNMQILYLCMHTPQLPLINHQPLTTVCLLVSLRAGGS